MKCKKCGSIIPSASKFCQNCGLSVSSRTNETAPLASKKKLAILGTVAGVAVVVCILILLMTLKGRPVTDTGVHQVGQSPVMSAPVAPGLPKINQNVKQAPPPAVVAYVEHIKRIEANRVNMRVDLSPAFEMLKKAQGIQGDVDDQERGQKQQDISTGIDEYTQKWQKLVDSLNSIQPPSGCEQLAGAYATALGKYSQVMINIQIAINKQDISSLMAMQGTAQSDVDVSLQQADQELSNLCQNFGMTKSFGITPDKGVDSLLTPLR